MEIRMGVVLTTPAVQDSPCACDLRIPGKCSEESAAKCTVSDSGWQGAYDMFLSLCSSLQSDGNSSLVQVSGTLSKKRAACRCSISQEIANSP